MSKLPFIPAVPYTKFYADAQGKTDYSVDVIPIKNTATDETLMGLCGTTEAIYLTKAQAKAFFNLEEKELHD